MGHDGGTGKVSLRERRYLRTLAHRMLELANEPENRAKAELWYAHNALEGKRPMIVMETGPFYSEMAPPLACESEVARRVESHLAGIVNEHKMVGDDKVVPDEYQVGMSIWMEGTPVPTKRAADASGRQLGYAQDHPIKDIAADFHKLQPYKYKYAREHTMQRAEEAFDVIGDILPVRLRNGSLTWAGMVTNPAVSLMGLERLLFAMVDDPDGVHRLFSYITDNVVGFVDWQESEGLLTLNNGNDYAGAGSYGFTRELPASGFDGNVRARDMWINANSQESSGISPEMYGEFVYPYTKRITDKFGLAYYGCCEPVNSIWEGCLSKMGNLRKVSVSIWCDEEYMGDALRGGRVIYSRKPSPNHIGVGAFDEAAFRAHIGKTVRAADGCGLEFIYRDVYTLCGDPEKPRKAVRVMRELTS